MSDTNEIIRRTDGGQDPSPSILAAFVDAMGMSTQLVFTGIDPFGYEGLEVDVQDQPASCVKVERAGMLGLINCEFDAISGVKLSTTRTVDVKPYTDTSGEIMGPVIDIEVDCPMFNIFRCKTCPNRPRSNDQSATLTPEQLADLQTFHDTKVGL